MHTYHQLKETLVQQIIQEAMRLQLQHGYCVFINWSGHVDNLHISIRKNKDEYQEVIAVGEIMVNVSDYIYKLESQDVIDKEEMAVIQMLEFMLRQLTYMVQKEQRISLAR